MLNHFMVCVACHFFENKIKETNAVIYIHAKAPWRKEKHLRASA